MKKEIIKLKKPEIRLIYYIREIKYGSCEIFIQDGIPIRIEKAKQSIKLVDNFKNSP